MTPHGSVPGVMNSLHELAQDCSRAIASYAVPEAACREIERIVAAATNASATTVLTQALASNSCVTRQAFEERRVCIATENRCMVIAAPIRSGPRVFAVLQATYGSDVRRFIGGHSLSELVSAAGQVFGNALLLAERVPGGTQAILGRDAFNHYLRAHFALYRSFHVPFTVALFDLGRRVPESRIACAVELRWTIRKSDSVFDIEGACFAALLANCPAPHGHVAVERINRNTGISAHSLIAPRRGESFQHFWGRCMAPELAPVYLKEMNGSW